VLSLPSYYHNIMDSHWPHGHCGMGIKASIYLPICTCSKWLICLDIRGKWSYLVDDFSNYLEGFGLSIILVLPVPLAPCEHILYFSHF